MRAHRIVFSLAVAAGFTGCGDSESAVEPAGGFNREQISYKTVDNPGATVVALPPADIKETRDPPIAFEPVTTIKKGLPMAFEGVVSYFDPKQNELAFQIEMKKLGKSSAAISGAEIRSAFRKDDEFRYRIQLKAPADAGEHFFTLKLLHPPKPDATELQVSDLITGKIKVVDSK